MKRIKVIHNGKLKNIPANEAKVLLLLKKATLAPETVALEPIVWPAPVAAVDTPSPMPEPEFVQEPVSVAVAVELVEVTALEDAEPRFIESEPGDGVVTVTTPDEQKVEISERTGKPKRGYRRRDMTAEGSSE